MRGGGEGTKGYILQIGMTEKHAKTLELTEFEFAVWSGGIITDLFPFP